mgnify:CR=1 FL=1
MVSDCRPGRLVSWARCIMAGVAELRGPLNGGFASGKDWPSCRAPGTQRSPLRFACGDELTPDNQAGAFLLRHQLREGRPNRELRAQRTQASACVG